ncbi:hypothetical protein [Nonomuraea typhae]|uniref:DUF2510 domain-containing protein n=1 Tax=Nonomuraea typhae TaxID=2603600 RepID=A0ABW7Z9F0_9ACTN
MTPPQQGPQYPDPDQTVRHRWPTPQSPTGPRTWPPQQQPGPRPQAPPPQPPHGQQDDLDDLGIGTVRLPYTPDMLPDVEEYVEAKPPRSAWWWVIVAGGLVVLLAALAIGVVLWVRSSGL